ncbi:MAG: hypothetical protein AseanaTS_24980 [Candidatus Pelagadaptatus aseana]|uniref:DUF3429 domain-containing protein n=1 Tax=Candidatus Pelagadaptatus aseana TaxID=3120508 RepID=UPI0039B16AF0
MLRLTPILTWSGTLPFVGCVLWSILGEYLSVPQLVLEAYWIFIAYSIVILSFMAGTLWGKANHRSFSHHGPLLLLSNVWALLAWLLLMALMAYDHIGAAIVLLLAVGYWNLYAVEKRCLKGSRDYLDLRKKVTFVVMACHGLMFVLML